MAVFKSKPDGVMTHGKPKVYFTCHQDDFDNCFEQITEKILELYPDCIIFYTPDMTDEMSEEDKNNILSEMKIFVVPITLRLMTEENRTMNVDIAYAKKNNIALLPIMMDNSTLELYRMEKNFGRRQYVELNLSRFDYAEKLKKHLESVLLSDETIKEVRDAFDAYIFLSYRQKDLEYAKRLMKIIHDIPECRDVAIWYDVYITYGEDFEKNIEDALHKSQLFTLLVTPSLLEMSIDSAGKPQKNYVMRKEYPDAKDANMSIFAAEMIKTDLELLRQEDSEFPTPVSVDNDGFYNAILDSVRDIINFKNDNDPKHIYLIGLAYLNGIDMEINVARGIEMITAAAEAGLLEAMKKLFELYRDGNRVPLDYKEALKWAERVAEFCTKEYGEEDAQTLFALHEVGFMLTQLGKHKKALDIFEKVYPLRCKVIGEKHHYTLITLDNIACLYRELGNYAKSLELHKQAYELQREVLGETHIDTLKALINLSATYSKCGDNETALILNEKAYELECKLHGETHHDSLLCLMNLSINYGVIGNYDKSFELLNKSYRLCCEVLGENHPLMAAIIGNFAGFYNYTGDHAKALEFSEKAYSLNCRILGDDHPDTLASLNNLADTYHNLGDLDQSITLHKKAYNLGIEVLGEKHPDTLTFLNNLAGAYKDFGYLNEAFECIDKVYSLRQEVLGEKHPNTLTALSNLAYIYSKLRDFNKALELFKKEYVLSCEVFGKKHSDTLLALSNLATSYLNIKEYKKALELYEELYDLQREVYGLKDPRTLETRKTINFIRKKFFRI